jgi:subfamily B ATP-binding cassette protein MsbA
MAAGESVFGLIDETDEINTGKKLINNTNGKIVFQDVGFSYTLGTPVIQNLNLTIEAGESVAFVGATGSGKSTLIQLLMRFYTPKTGLITIDGVDILKVEMHALRKKIALVDQNVRLFNTSVAKNIAFGQTEKMPITNIKQAAYAANAQDFIEKLTHQFDYEIGENGIKLSGGQRQRLAIARAIAKDAPILILDEATSALDSATEQKVQAAINTMQKGRTTLIIAHRLSTIQKADKIVVLSQGRIVEQGSHQDLLAKKGAYSILYAQQFKV